MNDHSSGALPGGMVVDVHPDTGEPGPEQVWQEPVDRLLAGLKTKAAGLITAEVQSRLATYGPNDAATVKPNFRHEFYINH
jgi:hypothetical protein